MIAYDLVCGAGGHRFEGWFGSSGEFAEQQARGLVCCPVCGSAAVTKAVMAPNLARKSNQQAQGGGPVEAAAGGVLPAEIRRTLTALAEAQARALAQSRWVGARFAEDSRAMHYGEQPAEPIHGQATPEQAAALVEEGIAIVPLPFPIAPPDELN